MTSWAGLWIGLGVWFGLHDIAQAMTGASFGALW